MDFFCADAKLVIELDGSRHYTEEGLEKDRERDEYLANIGFEAMRISNCELNTNFDGVCLTVFGKIGSRKW